MKDPSRAVMFETKQIEGQGRTCVYKRNELPGGSGGVPHFPRHKRGVLTRYQIKGL